MVLDRTAFYPTGGGQPHDTGWINEIPVIDVIEKQNNIMHTLEAPLEDDTVIGKLDWKRRFDHMQQHAGQHILSACFRKIAGANTSGFHLGNRYVSIDLDRQDLKEEHIITAEQLANSIVFDNIPIKSYIVRPEQLAKAN